MAATADIASEARAVWGDTARAPDVPVCLAALLAAVALPLAAEVAEVLDGDGALLEAPPEVALFEVATEPPTAAGVDSIIS